VGAVVDGVSDVVQLGANDIKEPPRLGSIVDSSYLAGVATQGGRMILALDIEKLLSAGELNLLEAAGSAAAAS
jgi:purine-binding chemotaxis protein CheW